MRLFNVRPSLTLDARERKFTFTISQFNFPSPSQPHTARGKTGEGTVLRKQCQVEVQKKYFGTSLSNNKKICHREVNYNT